MMKVRGFVKAVTSPLRVDNFFRQAYVEAMLTGERLKFALTGRPDPSTAILLAGSGRSGTTWLQEVLSALPGTQQIFEPLHPTFNPYVRQLTGWDEQDPYFRAWYLPPDEEQPEWTALLKKVLTGRFRNYWTDYERNAFFPNRFLIKDVRSNMYLGYTYKHFRPCIVYVLRHPCAVIYSRLTVRNPWYATVDDILNQPLLVKDYLQSWTRLIKKEHDLLGAHAVWWAVENLVALKQLNNHPHYLIFYEDLVLKPQETITNLVNWLGYAEVPPKLLPLLANPSRMSSKKVAYHSKMERLQHWQKVLSTSEQRRILDWAHRLGLMMYSTSPLPRVTPTDNMTQEHT